MIFFHYIHQLNKIQDLLKVLFRSKSHYRKKKNLVVAVLLVLFGGHVFVVIVSSRYNFVLPLTFTQFCYTV